MRTVQSLALWDSKRKNLSLKLKLPRALQKLQQRKIQTHMALENSSSDVFLFHSPSFSCGKTRKRSSHSKSAWTEPRKKLSVEMPPTSMMTTTSSLFTSQESHSIRLSLLITNSKSLPKTLTDLRELLRSTSGRKLERRKKTKSFTNMSKDGIQPELTAPSSRSQVTRTQLGNGHSDQTTSKLRTSCSETTP